MADIEEESNLTQLFEPKEELNDFFEEEYEQLSQTVSHSEGTFSYPNVECDRNLLQQLNFKIKTETYIKVNTELQNSEDATKKEKPNVADPLELYSSLNLCDKEKRPSAQKEKKPLKSRLRRSKVYKCSDCKFESLFKHKWDDHQNGISERKLRKCSQCKYETLCLSDLRYHILNHFPKVKYKCIIASCSFKTNHKRLLNYHLSNHSNLKFKYSKSILQSSRKINLTNFYLFNLRDQSFKRSKEQLYKCSKCSFKTLRNNIFKNHHCTQDKDEHLQNILNGNLSECSKCTFKTFKMEDFEKHLACHKSSFYDYEIMKVAYLETSYLDHNKVFLCPICSFNAIKPSWVFRHMVIHYSEKLFRCDKCEFATKHKSTFENHHCAHEKQARVQEKEKHLKSRLRGSKVYKCSNYKFESLLKHKWDDHQKEISERRLRKCSLCNYESLCLGDLRSHTLSHFQKIIYNCCVTSCSFKTNHKRFLNYHLTKHSNMKLKYSKSILQSSRKMNRRGQSLKRTKKHLYKCSKCSFKTLRNSIFKNHHCTQDEDEHLQNILNGNLSECSKCTYKTFKMEDFEKHLACHKSFYYNYEIMKVAYLNTKYSGHNKVFICPVCSFKAKRPSWIFRHMFVHYSEKPFKCPKCQFAYKYKSTFKIHCCKQEKQSSTQEGVEHLPNILNGNLKVCSKCSFKTFKKEVFKNHHCTQEKWPSAQEKDEHLPNILNGNLSECSKCSFKTFKMEDFERHLACHKSSFYNYEIMKVAYLETSYLDHNKVFLCPVCSFKAIKPSWVFRHMVIHYSEKPYDSPICEFAAKHKSTFENHHCSREKQSIVQEEKEHLQNILNENLNKCSKCSFKTFRKEVFKNHHCTQEKRPNAHEEEEHLQNILNENLNECSKCTFKTFRKDIFERHFACHNSFHYNYEIQKIAYLETSYSAQNSHKKMYLCPFCSYKSHKPSLVFRHLLVHNSERPYKCTKCEFAAKQKPTLENHHCKQEKQSSTEEEEKHLKSRLGWSKVYKCSDCKFESLSKHKLDDHLKGNSERRLRKCSQCKYETLCLGDFRSHTLSHFQKIIYNCYVTSCSFKTKYKFLLNCHLTKHSNMKFKYSKSILQSSRKINLRDQSLKRTKEHLYKYSKCSFKTLRNNIFKNHYCTQEKQPCAQEKDENLPNLLNENLSECSKCSFKTFKMEDFERHLACHKSSFYNYEIMKVAYLETGYSGQNKVFLCPVCSFNAIKPNWVFRHMVLHYSEKLFKCDKCEFATKHKSSFENHCCTQEKQASAQEEEKNLKSIFSRSKMYKCSNCKFIALSKHKLDVHLKGNFEKRLRICSQCNYETVCLGDLRCHILNHFQKVKYKCIIASCSFKTNHKRYLNYHLPKHSNLKFKYSKSTFKSLSQINAKKKEKPLKRRLRGSKVYKCSDCKFESFFKHIWDNHHKGISERKLRKCSLCNYETLCLADLRSHSLKHFKKLKYKCSITSCSFKTNLKESFNFHLLKHKDLKFRCAKCNYRSISKIGLKKHFLIHSKWQNLKACLKCNFKTLKKKKFEKHLKIHDSNLCTCYKCTLEFETHLVSHDASFACHKCNFKANKKLPLVVHYLLKHYLHHCLVCDFKAHFKSMLKDHMIVHSMVKVNECSKCEFVSKCKKDLENHLLSHYNEKPKILANLPSKTLSENNIVCQSTCNENEIFEETFNNSVQLSQKVNHFLRNNEISKMCTNILGKNVKNPVKLPDKKTPFACSLCFFKGENEHSLNEHLKNHTLRCCWFNFKYNDKYNLKIHVESNHITYKGSCKLFKCDKCDFETENSSELVDHLLIHVPKQPLKCTSCHYYTNRKERLREHIKRYHTSFKKQSKYSFSELFLYKCSRCEFKTFSKLRFEIHNKKSNEKKVIKCFHCLYETLCLGNLHSHIYKHFKKLKKCQFCNFQTNHKYLIKTHLKRHRDLKFKCVKCDFRFSCIHNMKKHKLKHTEQVRKVFKCNFKTKNIIGIKGHLRNIHNSNMKYNKCWSNKLKSFICNQPSFELPRLSINCKKCAFETKKLIRLYPSLLKNNKDIDCNCQNCDRTPTLEAVGSENYLYQPETVLKCNFCKFENICTRKFFLHLKLHHFKLSKNKIKTEDNTDKLQKSSIPKILSKNTNKVIKSRILPYTLIDKKKIYVCYKCNFENENKFNMRYHLINHFEKRKYKCKSCDYSCNEKRNMKVHEAKHEGVLLSCSACSHKTVYKSALRLHFLKVHGAKNFKCSKCDYRTYSSSSLKRHERNHNKTKLFKCSECSFEANVKSKLSSHFKSHNLIKVFCCSECSFQTNYKQSMTQHERIHNENLRFKCTECDYTCTTKHSIQVHMRKHTGENFQCSECSYTTPSQPKLRSHFLKHNKTKLYKCPSCSYESNYKHNLETHKLNHSGIRLYKCDDCKFTTNYKYMMGQHALKYH